MRRPSRQICKSLLSTFPYPRILVPVPKEGSYPESGVYFFPPTHPLNNSERDIQHIGNFLHSREIYYLQNSYNSSKIMTLNIEKVPNQESSLLVVYSTSEPHS